MPIPDGTVDILKIKNGAVTTYKWLRDSWARKKIIALQQAIAAIVIPTRTSQLTNDSGYITQADVPPGSTPSSTTPLMDGTAAVGTETAFARGDHRHPSDTNKADKATTLAGYGITNAYTKTEVDGMIPTVPTKTSDLTNDSDFQTGTQVGNAISAEAGLMVPYGYCTTAAATVAKVVTVSPAVTELTTGLTIAVKFQYANTGSNPTLNVNSLGAKAIKRYGTTAAGTSAAANWNANSVVMLTYDGTYWMLVDFNNTTYSGMTDAEYQAGTSTTNRLITPARLKAAIELHAPVQSVNGQDGDVTIAVPTKTSDLTNDSGFITSAPVTSVNGQTGAVNLTASDVGALPSTTPIPTVPTNVSAFTNDAGYITASDVPDASTATPAMDGTGAAGTSDDYARADHVHPADTSKQDALTSTQLSAVNSGATANDFAINDASVLCTITPIEPTLTNGSHDSTYGGCWYYKRGCTVTVHIGVTGLTASADTTIFTLPAGYRPRSIIGFVGNATSTTNYGRARIGTDGTVHVNSTSTRMVAQVTFDAFS